MSRITWRCGARLTSLCLAAAWAASPPVAVAAAPAGPVAFPDCGAMWLDGAEARARVDVFAGLLSRRDTPVRYELPPEYAIPQADLPRAAVYECRPGGDLVEGKPTSDPRLVPVPALVARSEEGGGQVTWNLSAQSLPLSQRRFHVYLASPNGPELPAPAVEGKPLPLPGENLLPNAGFERLDDGRGGQPTGWSVDATGAVLPAAARSGQRGVASQSGTDAARAGSGQSLRLIEPVRVRPGVRYFLDAWVRVDAASGHAVSISAPFLDADGNPTGTRIHVFTREGETTDGWTQMRSWAIAPPNASALTLTAGSRSDAGPSYFDDFSLYADPVGIGPSPRVVAAPIEDRANRRRSLELPAGGEAWLFDFGPDGSASAGGFIPIAPGEIWNDRSLYGFCGEGAVRAAEGPRPDALAQDYVDFSDSAFCLRMPDGPVVVWMLLGDYTTPNDGPWAVPDFYSKEVAVQAGTQARRAENARIDFGSFHREPEDDAVAFLKNGAYAAHMRYVDPRFTSVLFESQVENGVLKVICQPSGACPVTALGVFRGASMAQAQEELSYLNALRRWSFTVSWAKPHTPATLVEPLLPDVEEERLGFAAFAADTDSDVYPHTVPSRSQVDALRQGLRVRLTRGETTAVSLGVYPLVFRRALSVDVEPPVNRIGEGLSGDSIQVDEVRYRMRRMYDRAPDPRFAVRPEELVPATGMSVRPGLTRQLWITVRGDAAPGEYVGHLQLDAGQGRVQVIPLTIEILGFQLGPTAVHQGVLGGGYLPGGDISVMSADMAAHGMDLLYLYGTPNAEIRDGKARGDWSRWDRQWETARQAGLDAAAVIAQTSGEAAFDLTGEPRVDPAYDGSASHRGKKSFSAQFDAAFVDLIADATAHSRMAGWPPLVHYVAGESASEGELGLAYERHVLQLCRKASDAAFCAASINGPGSLAHLDWMDAVMPNYGVGLDARSFARMRDTPKGRIGRSVWLYNTGGARYGRGLYPWAAGADAAVHEMYMFTSKAGDAFDPWDSDEGFASYTRPGSEGPLPLLRWERARLGANDAKLLAHLQSRIEQAKAKNMGGADAVRQAELFLTELKSRIDLNISAANITWDYRLAAIGFPRGPDFDLVRGALLDLAVALEALFAP